MRASGFRVNPIDSKDPSLLRRKLGVPDHLDSCHTGVIGGYAIVGHVPAREVKRLLAEKPKARGLAVAGMPMGSPGMESGDRREPFDVILVLPDGSERVYARYGKEGVTTGR